MLTSTRSPNIPYSRADAVAPSNLGRLPGGVCDALWIGTPGSVSFLDPAGNVGYLPDVPAGVLTIQVRQVRSTDTTAAGIVALYHSGRGAGIPGQPGPGPGPDPEPPTDPVNVIVDGIVDVYPTTPGSQQLAALHQLVDTLYAAGIWGKMDSLVVAAAQSEGNAIVNLVDPSGPTAVPAGLIQWDLAAGAWRTPPWGGLQAAGQVAYPDRYVHLGAGDGAVHLGVAPPLSWPLPGSRLLYLLGGRSAANALVAELEQERSTIQTGATLTRWKVASTGGPTATFTSAPLPGNQAISLVNTVLESVDWQRLYLNRVFTDQSWPAGDVSVAASSLTAGNWDGELGFSSEFRPICWLAHGAALTPSEVTVLTNALITHRHMMGAAWSE